MLSIDTDTVTHPPLFVGEMAVTWLRSQPDKQRLIYACYFDEPIDLAAKRYASSDEWAAVRKLLPLARGTVLDVGAGRGISSYAFACDGWAVTALEPDPSPVVGAEAINRLVQLTNVDIGVSQDYGESLPFDNNSFDVVYVRQVLHHAYDLATMCREVQRVLKKGGRFIATREHVIDRAEDLQVFLASHPLHPNFGGENAYTLAQYTSAIQNSGLRLVKVMRPCDSPINQFPRTRAELRCVYHKKLSNHFGDRLASMLLSEAFPWSDFNLMLVDRVIRTRSRNPGRLFSFVAEKS